MPNQPFRGTAATATGLVTPGVLRGPHYRRLFRDVYLPAEVEPGLAVRARAAHLLLGDRAVVGGWAAAELLGASCGRGDAPVELVVDSAYRSRPGLVFRRDGLAPDEVVEIAGVRVTSPARTGYDLARRPPLVEGVVALDALGRACGVRPEDVVALGRRHLGGRGSAQLPAVLRLTDPRAESPMETRIRVAIVADGLPCPTPQHPVGPYRLDLAYPAIRLGIEYDGREHLTAERARHDLDRQAYLTAAGWTVLRLRAAEVHRRGEVAARVHQALLRHGRRTDRSVTEVVASIGASAP